MVPPNSLEFVRFLEVLMFHQKIFRLLLVVKIKVSNCYNMIIHSSNFWNVNNVLRKHSPELSLSQCVNMFTSSIFYYS